MPVPALPEWCLDAVNNPLMVQYCLVELPAHDRMPAM